MSRYTKTPYYDLTSPQVVQICSRARLGFTLIPGKYLVCAGIFLISVLAPHNLMNLRTVLLPSLLCFPGLLIFAFGFFSWLSYSKEMRFWVLIHFLFFVLDVAIIALVAWACKSPLLSHIDPNFCTSWSLITNSTRKSIENDFGCCGCSLTNTSEMECFNPSIPNCHQAVDKLFSGYLDIIGDIGFMLAIVLAVSIIWTLFAIRGAVSSRQAEQDRYFATLLPINRSANICTE
jgi:hypothetical protein